MSSVATSSTESTAATIFIKNLDKTVNHKKVFDTFSVYGNIMSCKVSEDLEGVSRGYAFLHFEKEEAAAKAVLEGNGMILAGKEIIVARFQSRTERVGENPTFTNVFVKNFGEEMDEVKLQTLFEQFGEITSCAVMRDSNKKSKGFGFVAFKNPEDAEKAVKEMNEKTVEGTETQLFVSRAQKKSEREEEMKRKYEQQKETEGLQFQGMNLYVKNLDDMVDDKVLKEIFDSFGAITSAKVMTYENGRSKGYGFVCFENTEDGTRALNVMNFKMVGSKPLYVSVAQRKKERKAQLDSQHMKRMASRLPGAPVYAPPQNGYYAINPAVPQNQGGYLAGGAAGVSVIGMGQPGIHGVQGQQNMQPYMAPNGGYMAQVPTVYGYQPMPVPQHPQGGYYNVPTATMNGAQVRNPQMPAQPHRPHLGYVANGQTSAASHAVAQTEAEQKQALGQHIFVLVGRMCQDQGEVGKITGMLMEMETAELIKMMNNAHYFQSKVNEASAVLHQSAKNPQQAFAQQNRM